MTGSFHLQTWLVLLTILTSQTIPITDEAVVPPPWADPKLNPCANKPGGWQLLFWPPDGKCYKIFQTGPPCPPDMELSPSALRSAPGARPELSAECRCPPATAQSARDGRCYGLYAPGPCDRGSYFAPDTAYTSNSSKRQWGVCLQMKKCSNPNEIFWPQDGKCYQRLTRGPCPRGQLLTVSPDRLSVCKCGKNKELRDFLYNDGNCYQHFTKGPCRETGELFLPDRNCGCYSFLPHYHEETKKCFEIGSIGPCDRGEQFHLNPSTRRSSCQCKSGYIRYQNRSSCFRPFTQGPCPVDQILVNTTTCITQPCERGYLYFDSHRRCYRIGSRGPCKRGRLVTFDFATRPSVDGISYNGVCSCEKNIYDNDCDEKEPETVCKGGTVKYGTVCYKLYAQGPCPKGSWLAPRRTKKQDLWEEGDEQSVVCECVPGYKRTVTTVNRVNVTECAAPTVILAKYLNRNYSGVSTDVDGGYNL